MLFYVAQCKSKLAKSSSIAAAAAVAGQKRLLFEAGSNWLRL